MRDHTASERPEVAEKAEPHRLLADRCSRLIRFLTDLAHSQATRIVDVEKYPIRLWLHDLPDTVLVNRDVTVGDVLLEVPPVAMQPPPDLPPVLTGWVSLAERDDSSLTHPSLRPQGPRRAVVGEPVTEVDTVPREEAPEVLRAYNDWLPTWQAWAAADRVNAAQRALYEGLHTVYQRLTQEGDALELVLSTGLLTMRTPEGINVRHPLLATRLHVALDQRTAALVVRVPEEALTRLEDSALLGDSTVFHAERTNGLHERLQGAEPAPLGEPEEGLLRDWLGLGVGVAGAYSSDWCPQRDVAPTPRVHFAPVLLLRPRGRSALLNYYEQMSRALASDELPPLGLAQLVDTLEPSERLEWLESQGATSGSALGADPLFPLPANPEQAQIMDRLRGDNGVVVEGPPGTGKTHTIANLISALLAQGQRVLVTSQKAQALRVLRDKLPEDMQRLCVSLTDVAQGGSLELAGSVAALAAKKAAHNPAQQVERVERARSMRAQAMAKRAACTDQIRALRESETYQHPQVAPGYAGTLAQITAQLKHREPEYGWMPLPVHQAVAVGAPEAHELLVLLRSQTEARAARPAQVLPALDEFPTAPDARAQVTAAAEAARLAADGQTPLSGRLAGLSTEQVQELEGLFDTLDSSMAQLREALRTTSDAHWVHRAVDDGFARREQDLWDLLAQGVSQAQQAQEALRYVGLRQVQLPAGDLDPATLLRLTRNLRGFLASGGRLRKRFKPAVQQAAEPILQGAQVDGLPVDNVERLDVLTAYLDAETLTATVLRPWAHVGIAVPPELPLPRRVARTADLYRLLERVRHVLAARAALESWLHGTRLWDVPLSTVQDCDALSDALAHVRLCLAAQEATAELDRLVDVWERRSRATAAPPELTQLTDALRRRDADAYTDRLHALAAAHAEQAAQSRCDELLGRLHAAHPALAALLAATANDPTWQDRLAHLPQAWAWGQARTFFDEQREPGREQRLEGELAAAEQAVSQYTAQLATEQAWQRALERMNAHQVAALQSYRAAVDARGKGTGKYAAHYARAARDAMHDAQAAVPAWIMPLPDVLQTIPPNQNSFDVVIVDEASQASLESLFLLWLAPRVIVVGDDRQCTPPEVALGALEPIFNRLNDLLPDLPSYLRVAFTPRSSLFSILRARFGQVIRLREHFRCMPEIIEWSSNMFYRDQPLIPLRQYGADRLEPLRTQFVAGAYTEGKYSTLRNQVEAEALVDEVITCSNDPAYEAKTFGVVVLQGNAQVDMIRNALKRRMPIKEQERRRLRVGTPPDFQGDERHVVFLSMVLAPDTKTTSLTKLEYQRRFNVAASRAQDQVWLFHSVTPDSLNPADLRHSLLTYLQTRPLTAVADGYEDVTRDVPRPPYDSLFEQRIFLDIRARGYHVTPQVEVNGRRIDLVVTGGCAKLAVECDGDAWHSTPDQVHADLAREHELKRAGWRFWRVRESEYYFDPDAALATLWTTLEARGIEPFPVAAPAPKLDVEPLAPVRTWSPVALSREEGLDDADDEDLRTVA